MTYHLGKPQDVGGYRIAVVSRQIVTARPVGRRGAYCYCGKEPAFVLLRRKHVTTAMDMTGRKVTIAQVAALCPAAAEL